MKFLLIFLLLPLGYLYGAGILQGEVCTQQTLFDNCSTSSPTFTSCCVDALACSSRPCSNCCNKLDGAIRPCFWSGNTCITYNCPSDTTCSGRTNRYCCEEKTTCIWQSGSCRDVRNCSARTTGCRLSATNHGQGATCTCPNTHTRSGDATYNCNDGSWLNGNATCTRIPSNCTASNFGSGNTLCTISGTINHGSSKSGTCANGGSCSIACNDGEQTLTNNCTTNCPNNKCYRLVWNGDLTQQIYRCYNQGEFFIRWLNPPCCNRPPYNCSPGKYKNTCTNGEWVRTMLTRGGCAGGDGSGCFLSGVLITMGDGSTKPIQDIKVGDLVLGVSGVNKVIEVKKHYARPFKGLVYSINGSRVFVTGGHPFMTTKGWKAFDVLSARELNPTLDITKLNVGDILIKQNSETEVIKEWEAKLQDTKIYNFTADGDKTYYADGYLVHNK